MFSIFKKMHWFLRSYQKRYRVAFLFLILAYSLMMVPPWMIGKLSDAITHRTIDIKGLFLQIGLLLLASFIIYVSNYLWAYYLFTGADQIKRDSRRLLMRKFLRQSPVFYELHSTGSLMGKSTNDVNALGDFAGFGIMALIDATLYPMVLILIMGISVSWKLTFYSMLPLVLLVYITKKLEDRITFYFERSQETFDRLNEKVLENVSGVRVVRSYVREEGERDNFRRMAEEHYHAAFSFNRIIALFKPMDVIIPAISMLIALLIGGPMIGSGQITLGKFISFGFYLDMLIWPMMAFGEYITVTEQASTAMDRIQELLDYEEDIPELEQALLYDGQGDIEFINFSFRYGADQKEILKHIHLLIPEGSTLGVVGKIGAGKTTLLRQLLRFYPQPERSLFLHNQPIEVYAPESLRRRIGYVPQQHTLFSRSIRENILLGSQEGKTVDLKEVLEDADLTKDLAVFPEGLETLTGEKGIALSGGQKQRIAIARALMKDPEILILDDALSAVDATTEQNILHKIRQRRRGKTTLIAAHRLSALAHADHIIVLEEGRILQAGSHDTLIEEPGWYREQYLHQQLEVPDEV